MPPARKYKPARLAAGPLYRTIDRTLREEISSGRAPVGSLLPAETELCSRFNVSRYTVREAMRRLAESGLVERRQGAGTVVIARQAPTTFVQSARSMEELVQYAADTSFEIERVGMVTLDPQDAALCGGKRGDSWLKIEGVRRNSLGHALASVTVFVAGRYAAIADEVQGLNGAIFARVESRWSAPITDIIQEISAGELRAPIARQLGVKTGATGVRFRRRYLEGNAAIMLTSINWHAADRFVYEMHLQRNGG